MQRLTNSVTVKYVLKNSKGLEIEFKLRKLLTSIQFWFLIRVSLSDLIKKMERSCENILITFIYIMSSRVEIIMSVLREWRKITHTTMFFLSIYLGLFTN